MVMRDPRSGLLFANHQPAQPFFAASQISQFYLDHRGAGVQQVVLAVSDLPATVTGMRARGAVFMPTPADYCQQLARRLVELGVNRVDEEIEQLRQLEILVDGQTKHSYMLQIVIKDGASVFRDPQAGPFFIELLQRKGDQGFGAGNFRAPFESIEREQRQAQLA